MRISDWSSDVCSSDLDDAIDFLMLAHEAQEGMEAGMFGGDLVGCGLDDRRDMIAKLFAHVANERLEDFLFRIEIGVEAAERRAEIGRASCRERVCQYV